MSILPLFKNSIIKYDEVKKILEMGANADERDGENRNMLFFSEKFDRDHLVSLLVSFGANVNAQSTHPGFIGSTPLHHVIDTRRMGILREFIYNGANVNSIDNDLGMNPLQTRIFFIDHSNRNLLEYVKELIEGGVNISNIDNNGDTVLSLITKGYDEIREAIGEKQLLDVIGILKQHLSCEEIPSAFKTLEKMTIDLPRAQSSIDTLKKLISNCQNDTKICKQSVSQLTETLRLANYKIKSLTERVIFLSSTVKP